MYANGGTPSLAGGRRERPEPKPEAGRGSDQLRASRRSPRRILIVEDDDPTWRSLERALRAHAWRCVHATSVAEARALLRGDFDAILIDLNLGDGGSGEDVLDLLAARPTPVATVVLSGQGKEARANALGLDGVPYLDKPPEFAALRAALDEEVALTRMVIAHGLVGLGARVEKGMLRAMIGKLRASGGNQCHAALALGLPRTTLRAPSLAPTIIVYRYNGAFVSVASATGPAGGTAVATTYGLPATDWYVVGFGGASGSGRYLGNIKLTTAVSDDFLSSNAESYPLVTGVVQSGYLGVGDMDRFQIYIRSATTLSVSTTGTPLPTVDVRNSAGTLLATGTGAATVGLSSAGFYYVDIRDASGIARSCSLTATIGCAASGNCDDLTTMAATAVRNTWGDRFGGRLPIGASTATYAVTLNANENAVFSLADNSNTTCRIAMDLIPPVALNYFAGERIFRWKDSTFDTEAFADNGPAAAGLGGLRRGAGGHITAPVAGTYTVQVRRQDPMNTATCYYRLFIGRSTILGPFLPSW